MNVTPEGILVAVGWAISLTVAIVFAFRVIPEMAARRLCAMFGLQRVKLANGREIYAVEDLEGTPIKVPISVKKGEDGEDIIEYGYAPLPITMTYLAAEQAAMKMKMTFLNAKSQLARNFKKAGLEEVMAEGGGLQNLMPFLPKKLQAPAAFLSALGVGSAPKGGQSGQQRLSNRSGGQK
jgi:hypothetical protein